MQRKTYYRSESGPAVGSGCKTRITFVSIPHFWTVQDQDAYRKAKGVSARHIGGLYLLHELLGSYDVQ